MSDRTEDDPSLGPGEEEHKLKEHKKPIPGEGMGDKELEALPSNEEEEKEEVLLTTTKSLKKPFKASQQKIEEKIIPLTSVLKQLDKQGIQLDKITQMLQPVQRQIKSLQRQPELIRQIQSQLKQLQKHISQIQKRIGTTGKQNKKRGTLH
ncbi:hypothetical protein [Nitrososphaera sp. AFS]|uniref:hypothetical protein n=1 Tax=Nitrososphaera sp. AFS TaxID=2301191 RepID=UPI0013921FE8|nr:hypothetical protein [Nitrososphaera sp. AFS]NAL77566.1 hypothetical protein [Nitrososphaera sp. AFS]